MDAEILFFMTSKDQDDFLKVVEKHCDSISEANHSKNLMFQIGGCSLVFVSSKLEVDTLFMGKLEIRLSNVSTDIETFDRERAKTVFRKLRNWMKKHYWSRLAYLNQNKNNKLTPSRNHWLGPDAKIWKESDKKHLLKLSKTSWMVFEIGY